MIAVLFHFSLSKQDHSHQANQWKFSPQESEPPFNNTEFMEEIYDWRVTRSCVSQLPRLMCRTVSVGLTCSADLLLSDTLCIVKLTKYPWGGLWWSTPGTTTETWGQFLISQVLVQNEVVVIYRSPRVSRETRKMKFNGADRRQPFFWVTGNYKYPLIYNGHSRNLLKKKKKKERKWNNEKTNEWFCLLRYNAV
jgi:hypothetical protein